MPDEERYREFIQWAHDAQIELLTFRTLIPDIPSDAEIVLRMRIDKAMSALNTLEDLARYDLVYEHLKRKPPSHA